MRGSVVTGVLSAGLFAGSALAQDAVQWRVEDGGNGHWYQFNRVPSGICWLASRIAAEQAGGHLVTVTSAAENSFVIAYTDANNPGVFTGGPYLGATCENAPWGQWRWVTGEPFVFTGWGGGEPNSGGNERYVHLWRWGSLWWNDTSECGADSYIVEWSADCNSDGIVDFGQIRAGEFEDTNANNIPDCCEQGVACDCPADIDESGTVDAIDLAIVIGYWGTDGGKQYPQADIDGSGEIDGADLATLLGSWGPCE